MIIQGIRILAILAIVAVGSEAGAIPPSGKAYSLTELYRMALAYSQRIAISREDLSVAEQQREKAASALKPNLSAFGNYTRFSEKKTAIFDVVIQPESTTAWGLKLDQSLNLKGKEWIALKLAEGDIARRRFDLASVREAYLFDVASGYYEVLKAAQNMEIARTNVARLRKHRDAVQTRMRLEEVTKTALFRAEAELSGSLTDLIRAQNQLKLAKAILARLAGIPEDEEYAVEEPGPVSPSFPEKSLVDLRRTALSERAEMKSIRIQTALSEDRLKIARTAYWPDISLQGLYQSQETEPVSEFTSDSSLSATLSLNFPLYEGGFRKADIRQALAEKRQAETGLESLARDIVVEVEAAYLELQTQASVLQSLGDQLRFAAENYDAVTRQFQFGLADSLDVMDANTLLVTSERNLADAKYGYALSVLRLERSTGNFPQSSQSQND